MKKIMIMLLVLMNVSLVAKYHAVSSQKEFAKLLDKYPYAVVCFAPSGVMHDHEKLDSNEKQDVKSEFRSLQNTVKSASDSRNYKTYLQKDVGFLVVDVASRRVREVDEEYALKEFPTCLLFKDGQVNMMAQIMYPKSRYDILSLLEKRVGVELDKIIKDKKENERLERQERIAQYNAMSNYYPYGGWGGSYWGGPYWGYRYPAAVWYLGF